MQHLSTGDVVNVIDDVCDLRRIHPDGVPPLQRMRIGHPDLVAKLKQGDKLLILGKAKAGSAGLGAALLVMGNGKMGWLYEWEVHPAW